MANKFALIGHPKDTGMLHNYMAAHKQNYSKRKMKDSLLRKLFEWTPSFKAFDIELGKTEGAFFAATFLPEMLLQSRHTVVAKIEEALRLSEKEGATVAALGALTSVADGAQGEKVSKAVGSMSVTNGTTYTSALVIEGIKKIRRLVNIDLKDSKLAIVGATGSIGRTCSRYFFGKTKQLTLTGRNKEKLMTFFGDWSNNNNQELHLTTDNKKAVADADFVISVTSSITPIFESGDFKSGAVVCDVGFPKNISYSCTDRRDIIVYSGGLAQIPGEIKNATIWGLPSDSIIYGCFSEAMVIAGEGCFEYCTVGHSDIPLKNIEFINNTAHRHGFRVAPFFNNSKYYMEEDFDFIQRVREDTGGYYEKQRQSI
ncbi:MAG: hypothetical protein GY754_38225 [bacterium]|nr:hypothetical protein [bacterium]